LQRSQPSFCQTSTAFSVKAPFLLWHSAIATNVNAARLKHAVGFLGRSKHGERTGLQIAVGANLIAKDGYVWWDNDFLLACLYI
jgi:hypothetical protein